MTKPQKKDESDSEKVDVVEIIKSEIHKVEDTLKKVDEFYQKDLRKLERLSDKIAQEGGSWGFIFSFLLLLIIWVILNAVVLADKAFDVYPFILLNLFLSMIAAIQAPIILMSTNRSARRDQARLEIDLEKALRDLHVDQSSHAMLMEMHRDMA